MAVPIQVVIPLCVAILFGATKFELSDRENCILYDDDGERE
jgi:hypothetical protein